MAGLFENIFSGGVTAAGISDQMDRNTDSGKFAYEGAQQIGQDAMANSAFQPFSVASQTGNSTVGADGSVNAQLSGQMQGLSDTFLGNASHYANAAGQGPADYGQQGFYGAAQGMLGQSMQDPAARQAQIFADYQKAMQPGQDRQDQRLAAQSHAQGRSGITSSLYGGSGEQFANAMAREEAGFNAFNQASQMGLAEQAQQAAMANQYQSTGYQGTQLGMQGQAQNATLANQFLQGGMLPNQQLFNELNSGFTGSDLAQTGQLTGAQAAAQAGMGGLEAQLNAQKLNTELVGGMYGAGANAAGSLGSMIDDSEWFKNLW